MEACYQSLKVWNEKILAQEGTHHVEAQIHFWNSSNIIVKKLPMSFSMEFSCPTILNHIRKKCTNLSSSPLELYGEKNMTWSLWTLLACWVISQSDSLVIVVHQAYLQLSLYVPCNSLTNLHARSNLCPDLVLWPNKRHNLNIVEF